MNYKQRQIYSSAPSIVYKSDNDFILKKETDNEINVNYWRQKILQLLQESKNNPLRDLLINNNNTDVTIYKDHPDINGSHKYYILLPNTVIDATDIIREISKKVSKCKVFFEKIRINTGPINALSILITQDMQKKLNRENRRKEWMKERCNFRDICLVIICIFIILLCITMLDKHWEGYKEPWKNLMPFIKAINNNSDIIPVKK